MGIKFYLGGKDGELMSTKISIIIPCFNSGQFLNEAVESCLNSIYNDIEIIIVNDGSFESQTLNILDSLKSNHKTRIFTQENKGPSAARNYGVSLSYGDFLLFLDSDNKIHPEYLGKAIRVLEESPSIALVYTKPIFFNENGIAESRFKVRDFSFDALLAGNYIDMCSLARKEAFLKVGGFNESEKLSFGEDWDLWIKIFQSNWEIKFLDEFFFYYRTREDSIMAQIDSSKRAQTLSYFGSEHGYIIHQKYRRYFRLIEKIEKSPFKFFIKILINKYIRKKSFIE